MKMEFKNHAGIIVYYNAESNIYYIFYKYG
jgi:hypothetical protein